VTERIGSAGPWEQTFGYSRAVAAGPWVLVSGCTSAAPPTPGNAGAGQPVQVRHPTDAAWQARVALRTALDAVEQAGLSRQDVVRTRIYLTDIARDGAAVGRVHGEIFADVRPAATMVQVAALLDPRMLVEIEVEAYRGQPGNGAEPGR
jgi:enamine deaminase RidA (YjgF/YER057c/UK114 family)